MSRSQATTVRTPLTTLVTSVTVKITLCGSDPPPSTTFPRYSNWVPGRSGNILLSTSVGVENRGAGPAAESVRPGAAVPV